jgi:hypothetical protein
MDLKARKKAKFKKVRWLLAGSAAAFVVFVLLLLYRPGRFRPPDVTYDEQVSPYLTHELLPQLYNGAQLEEPFDLIVTQKGMNDIVGRFKWPRGAGGSMFSTPMVFFVPENIVLMGIVAADGAELVVTVVAEAGLDEEGLLNLRMAEVKVGAVNITPLAKVIAKRMYLERLAAKDVDTNDLGAQIAASLLDGEPFEPVFKIEDKKVRVEKITIEREKLTIRLAPAS